MYANRRIREFIVESRQLVLQITPTDVDNKILSIGLRPSEDSQG